MRRKLPDCRPRVDTNAAGLASCRCTSGFTLIEVVAALVILTILMGMIYTSLAGVLSTDDALSRDVRVREAGTTLMSIVDADLRAFMFYNYDFAYFAGRNEGGDGLPGSYVSFTALNYDLPGDASPYDLVGKVTYRLAEDGALVRTFEPVADYADAIATSEQVLYTGVTAFPVRFWDGEEWVDEWTHDPEDFACPRRVSLQLALVPEDDPEVEPVAFAQAFSLTTYTLAGEEDDTRPLIRRERTPREGTPQTPSSTSGTQPGAPTIDDGPPPLPDDFLQPPSFPKGGSP